MEILIIITDRNISDRREEFLKALKSAIGNQKELPIIMCLSNDPSVEMFKALFPSDKLAFQSMYDADYLHSMLYMGSLFNSVCLCATGKGTPFTSNVVKMCASLSIPLYHYDTIGRCVRDINDQGEEKEVSPLEDSKSSPMSSSADDIIDPVALKILKMVYVEKIPLIEVALRHAIPVRTLRDFLDDAIGRLLTSIG